MSNSYLTHHGIGGMRWGKKNGPPYPLDFDKLSSAERQAAKEKSIRDGDVVTTNRNRKHYTNAEINEVITRFDINQKLAKLERSTIKTGMDKANDLADKLGTLGNLMDKGYKVAETASKFSKLINGEKNNSGGNNNNSGDKKSKTTTTINHITKQVTKTIIDANGNSKTITKKIK